MLYELGKQGDVPRAFDKLNTKGVSVVGVLGTLVSVFQLRLSGVSGYDCQSDASNEDMKMSVLYYALMVRDFVGWLYIKKKDPQRKWIKCRVRD